MTTDPIKNLRIVFVLMLVLLLLPPILKLTEILTSWNETLRNHIEELKHKRIYWNMYLRFQLEFFLEIAIVSMLRCLGMNFFSTSDTILSVYAIC